MKSLGHAIDEGQVADHAGDAGFTSDQLMARIRQEGFDPQYAVYLDPDTGAVAVGNHRLMAVRALGYEQIPARPLPTDPEELLKIFMADAGP